MIIQYCSDLHLEFRENHKYITSNPIEPVGDILILAGDIVPFALMNKRNDFFNYVSDHFGSTYWLPGNHEYYDADISQRSGTINEKIRENVFLVNNTTIINGGARLILSTLWSSVSDTNAWQIENNISDFKVIQQSGKRFTTDDFNKLHNNCLLYVSAELEKEWTGKTIAATHHVPVFQHYPSKYKNSILNEVFAVELSAMIESKGPDYWIFGHHHYNVAPFTIGPTELLTNQLGYVHHYEHGTFNGGAHFKI
jgi:predicted phosphohydrolase